MNLRIGTWNLDNKPLTGRRLELRRLEECDVWLLTEVKPGSQVSGFHIHTSQSVMSLGQHWAAVLSREALDSLLPGLSDHDAYVIEVTPE
jgi:hypothetical protein